MIMERRGLPVATLIAVLASCAGPRAGHLGSTLAHHPELQNIADARKIDFPGHEMRVLLDAQALEGDLAAFEITVPARTLGAPPHVHRGEDELFTSSRASWSFCPRMTSSVAVRAARRTCRAVMCMDSGTRPTSRRGRS